MKTKSNMTVGKEKQIKGKSKIYNICLKNISTVNSFVWGDENNSFNHFEIMINELENFIQDQIDIAYLKGREERLSIYKYLINEKYEADCKDCDWCCLTSSEAFDKAKEHSSKTGHKVELLEYKIFSEIKEFKPISIQSKRK